MNELLLKTIDNLPPLPETVMKSAGNMYTFPVLRCKCKVLLILFLKIHF